MDGQFQTTGERDPAPAEWLASVLRRQFDELIRQRERVTEPSNVDSVHDMRVAIRRFRSLVGDLPALLKLDEIRVLRKELKKEAKLLGDVRDHDVYADSLRKMAAADKGTRQHSGIQLMIDENDRSRQDAFLRLEAALQKHSAKMFAERTSEAIGSIIRESHIFSDGDVKAVGRAVISERLRDLFQLGGGIYDPFDKKGLHKMRIAAKRLRYSAELFGSVLGPAAEAIASEASKIQSLLGDVHDRDVWTSSLTKDLRHEDRSRKHSGKYAALEYVFSRMVKKRSRRYRSVLKLWSKWRKDRFFENSIGTLNDRQP